MCKILSTDRIPKYPILLAESSGNRCDPVKCITLDTFWGKRYQVRSSKGALHSVKLSQLKNSPCKANGKNTLHSTGCLYRNVPLIKSANEKIHHIWGIKTKNTPYMMSRYFSKSDTILTEARCLKTPNLRKKRPENSASLRFQNGFSTARITAEMKIPHLWGEIR